VKLNHTIEQLAAMTVRADSRPLAEDCLALIRENERLRKALDIAAECLEWAGDDGGYESVTCATAAAAARRALGGSSEYD